MRGAYKLLAKVLAFRFKSMEEGSFVEGRQILVVVLVANETIDSRLRSGVLGVV